RIYVFDPETNGYLEIPYRDLSRSAISLWEHRLAIRRLREQNKGVFDEATLFRAVMELRAIEKNAAGSSRKARRNHARRQENTPVATESLVRQDTGSPSIKQSLLPFTEIEEW